MKNYKKTLILILLLGSAQEAKANILGLLFGFNIMNHYTNMSKDFLYKEIELAAKGGVTKDKTDAVVKGLQKMAINLSEISSTQNFINGTPLFLPEVCIDPFYKRELREKLEDLYKPEIDAALRSVDQQLLKKIAQQQKNIIRENKFTYEEVL